MPKPYAPEITRPRIIAVMNRKGGVGKTNTVINLSTELSNRGYRVTIADTEKDGGCVHWQELAGDSARVPVIAMYDPMIKINIKAYYDANDFILVDTAGIITDAEAEEDGKASTINSRVMGLADYVIVPLTPSAADFRATQVCVESLEKIREFRDGKPFFRVLLTSTRANEELTRLAIDMFGADYEYPVFMTNIRRSEEFKKSYALGTGVVNSAKTSAAAKDVQALTNELLRDFEEGRA